MKLRLDPLITFALFCLLAAALYATPAKAFC